MFQPSDQVFINIGDVVVVLNFIAENAAAVLLRLSGIVNWARALYHRLGRSMDVGIQVEQSTLFVSAAEKILDAL